MSIYTFIAPDGARCQVHDNGAHLTSWTPAGGEEQLFLSPRSAVGPGASIRGGAPVIFPQFAGQGPLPKHGFARRLPWGFVGQEAAAEGRLKARFELRQSPATLAEWPHAFRCGLEILLGGRELSISLQVDNSGERAFSFSAALHTYLAVAELSDARLLGLGGARYLDSACGEAEGLQAEAELAFGAEVDRIYPAAPPVLTLREGSRSLSIGQRGFSDTVVWNPGEVKGSALGDLEAGGWRRFVCVEAAVLAPPVTLAPGGDWSGMQELRA
jgi:glucose-6-phosphate 1-epimerase